MTSQYQSKHTVKLFLISSVVTVSIILSSWLLPILPLRPGDFPSVEFTPEFDVPSDPEYFFIHGRQPELSQSILYHDLGDSIIHVQQADVLFIGNSRMPLGLRGEFLLPSADAFGIRMFSLGMGHSERVRFALDLIRKHDLRPKVVVAVGGPYFYMDLYSEMSRQAIQMSKWDAMKNQFEATSWWNIQYRLHQLVPKIEYFRKEFQPGYIYYRSSRTGWWYPSLEGSGKYPVGYAEEEASYADYLPLARELHQELNRRGSVLVLTMVPYGSTRIGHLAYFSEKLGVSVVRPEVPDLRTSDGSHLNRESARRYSHAFWAEFIALPEVRERLSLPGS